MSTTQGTRGAASRIPRLRAKRLLAKRLLAKRFLLVPGLAVALFLPGACGGAVANGTGGGTGGAASNGMSIADGLSSTSPALTVRQGGAPAPSLGSYLAARHAQDVADGASAAALYLRALDADPQNVTLVRRAYFFLLGEGRFDEALLLARRTMDLDPDATVAPLVLAIGAVAGGDYAEASRLADGLAPDGLNSFLVPLLKGWAEAGRGNPDAALDALAPLAQSPHLAQLYDFHAGMVLDLVDRQAAAWELYDRALTDGPLTLRTVEVVSAFLRRTGREAEALALIEEFAAGHGGSTLVEAVLTRVLTAPPGWRPVPSARHGLAEALYGAASSVMQGGAADTALMFARLSLMLDPDFAFARLLVGDILGSQGRWADAADVFAAVPADSPVIFPVRLQLAEAKENLGLSDAATGLLRAMAATYPDAAAPLVQLGDLYRRQEQWGPAIEAYRAARARLPETVEAGYWALYFSLGVALERGGQWPEAEEAFQRALDLNPDQPLVLNYLGYSWIDRGMHLEKGKALIKRAVEQRPHDGYIVDSLGWAYYLLGEYEKAVEELERAVELTPADPTINDHLGDAYWRVGRRLEARFQWERALGLDPEPKEMEIIRRKLTEGLPTKNGS